MLSIVLMVVILLMVVLTSGDVGNNVGDDTNYEVVAMLVFTCGGNRDSVKTNKYLKCG